MRLPLLGWIVLGLSFLLAACQHAVETDTPRPGPKVREQFPERFRAVLEQPESLTIHALHPVPGGHAMRNFPKERDFHNYEILRSAEIEDPAERAQLIAWIYAGIEASDGMVAACFNPRHGLRAQRNEQFVELVICFECLSMQAHGSGAAAHNALTTRGYERRITALFESHGVRIHSED